MSELIRILYVDDYPLDRELVRDALEKEQGGFQVTEARSRADFEARLAEGDYDLVLSDFNILGFEGLQVLDAVHARNPQVPVVIVTGTGSEEIAVEALKRGAADYVIKTPKHIRRLPLVIRAALEKRRLGVEHTRAAEALQESETSFRYLFTNNPHPMWVYDLETLAFLEVNDTAVLKYGFSRDEFLQMRITDIRPAEDVARLLENVRQTRPDIQFSGEWRHRLKNGSLIDVEIVSHKLEFAGRPAALVVAHDVTERKRAEKSRQESEERFHRLATNSPDVIYVLDLTKNQTVFFNREEFCGYSRSELLAPGSIFFAIHPDDLSAVRAHWHQVMQRGSAGGASAIEYRLKRKDGDWEWVQSRETILSSSAGDAPTQIIVTLTLITERKRAEAALRESEDRYRDLVEHSHDLICTHDLQGRILSVNPAAAKQLGIDADTLLKMNLRDILAPEVRDQFAEYLVAIQRDGTASGLMLVQTSTGEKRIWEYTNTLRTEGVAAPIVRGMVSDITERKHRERELEAIANVSTALRVAQTRAAMLPILLDQLLILLNADGAAFEMLDPVSGETITELGRGIWAPVTGERIPPGKGLTAQVLATRQSYLNNDAPNDRKLFRPDLIGGCTAIAGVPLIAQEQIIGLLWIARKTAMGDGEMRLFTAIADIAANAIHRATLHEQTERQVERLAALHAIDRAIGSNIDLHITLDLLLAHVTTQLRVDAATVLLLNPHLNTLEFIAERGFRGSGITRLTLRLGEDHAGQAALERRLISIPNLKEAARPFTKAHLTAGEDFIAYLSVPLIAKGKVKGVLEVFHRALLSPDPEWMDFFETLAGQAAIAIDNAELFNGLQSANSELVLSYDATIEGWSRALDLRDKETEGHTQRVTEMTLRLARAMGLNEAELVQVRRGALLHDIGKMGIPDSILLKPGALSDEEWKVMRKHPEYAYNMLAPIEYLRHALDIPHCHHEKWDGTGYPRGLSGEQIPLSARIFAVVDVWDAMSSDRPYRTALSKQEVREHIRAQAGRHFDLQVVEIFLQLIGEVALH
ncbi:MAG: PAS domain S-box protein [Chloroflexi bacterium]|nr:PAS domain S-box protein [Chloroflexota bacterium]